MANSDTPFGLKPIFPSQGSGSGGSVQKVYLPADYATAVFIGDPVIKVTAGSNDVVVTTVGGTYDIGSLPEVNLAGITDASEITGVVVGFEASNRDSSVYGLASTVRVALVQTDPYQEYLIQGDTALDPLNVGQNANGLTTHAGNTTTGLSGIELDSSDAGADASAPFLIMRMHNAPDNEPNAAFNKIVVRVNLSTETATRAGLLGI